MNDLNVEQLGQVFTPDFIVQKMLQLKKNNGRTLEPSAGNGAFFKALQGNLVGIELDKNHCQEKMLNMDFFAYPIDEKFDTIIGNPPYVKHQNILPQTKALLNLDLFDERSNLYLFFIEKCIHHLNAGGELIFITPRDFLKSTASIKLNEFLYQQGTITDFFDLGDNKVFSNATPNCVIFRFEKGNFNRTTQQNKRFFCEKGQLYFTEQSYSLLFSDVFKVKVGAVSGMDKLFKNPKEGNLDFVTSITAQTGQTEKMIWVNEPTSYLIQHKEALLSRKVRKFNENNWWEWGRKHFISKQKRIYVNAKTRNPQPFFLNDCLNYDGSVLALFPHNQNLDLETLKNKLNQMNWTELGFICDGRYLFSQKSLENTFLPDDFLIF